MQTGRGKLPARTIRHSVVLDTPINSRTCRGLRNRTVTSLPSPPPAATSSCKRVARPSNGSCGRKSLKNAGVYLTVPLMTETRCCVAFRPETPQHDYAGSHQVDGKESACPFGAPSTSLRSVCQVPSRPGGAGS